MSGGAVYVFAHGVGGRSDLPLPLWMVAYGAAFVLLISFTALRILWPRPRLAAAAAGVGWSGAPPVVGTVVGVAGRVIALLLFGVTLGAAWAGVDNAASNIAPVAVYVVFWVGMQVVSVVAGDVWRGVNPYDTLAGLLRLPERTRRVDPGQWTAAAGVLVFAWLELAYHTPSAPRAIAIWLTLHSLSTLAGGALWGRAWVRSGEAFAGLFGLLAHIAPVYQDTDTGRLRLRWPLAGLARVPLRRGTAEVVFVALGSTTFDGFSRTRFWNDVLGDRSGWDRTWVNTTGLITTIAVVAMAYVVATRVSAAITDDDPQATLRAYVPSLIPIAFAYALAHYFSLLVFETQNFVVLASDPFGRGWDLFGTIDGTVDYRAVSTRTIALVQAGAIVGGHVLGVVAAHDKAVERHPARLALHSQYPLLAVMILYTIGGLLLLLGA